jgi:hypothetical protein
MRYIVSSFPQLLSFHNQNKVSSPHFPFPSLSVFQSESKRIWVLFGVYFLGSIMAISFLYQSPSSSFDASSELTNLTWAQFENHCAMNSANQIRSQTHCSQLKGMEKKGN